MKYYYRIKIITFENDVAFYRVEYCKGWIRKRLGPWKRFMTGSTLKEAENHLNILKKLIQRKK